MHLSENNRICWLGISVDLPEEWSIARHSVNPEQGRLVFVDPRRQRGELGWHRCERTPDIARSLEDFQQQVLEQHPDATFSDFTCKGWRGVSWCDADRQVVTRALHYAASHGRLLDLMVLGDDMPVATLYRQCRSEAPADAATAWRAFGIDCAVPPGWHIRRALVYPMDVTLRFSPDAPSRKEARSEAIIRRLALADSRYSGDGEALIRAGHPRLDYRIQPTVYCGHAALAAEAYENNRLFERWLGKRRCRRERLWACRPENALYHVTTISPVKEPAHPDAFTVACAETT